MGGVRLGVVDPSASGYAMADPGYQRAAGGATAVGMEAVTVGVDSSSR